MADDQAELDLALRWFRNWWEARVNAAATRSVRKRLRSEGESANRLL